MYLPLLTSQNVGFGTSRTHHWHRHRVAYISFMGRIDNGRHRSITGVTSHYINASSCSFKCLTSFSEDRWKVLMSKLYQRLIWSFFLTYLRTRISHERISILRTRAILKFKWKCTTFEVSLYALHYLVSFLKIHNLIPKSLIIILVKKSTPTIVAITINK